MIETKSPVGEPRAIKSGRVHALANAVGIYAVVILLVIIGCAVSREFFTVNNITNTIRGVALLGIVSVGVAFVTYSGHYADLSVPSIMAPFVGSALVIGYREFPGLVWW